jgi:hypothetical protein
MFKVKDKFIDCTVYNTEFNVHLSKATQDQLQHLYRIGFKGVELLGKKPKNKPLDNFITETNIYKDEQENASE